MFEQPNLEDKAGKKISAEEQESSESVLGMEMALRFMQEDYKVRVPSGTMPPRIEEVIIALNNNRVDSPEHLEEIKETYKILKEKFTELGGPRFYETSQRENFEKIEMRLANLKVKARE